MLRSFTVVHVQTLTFESTNTDPDWPRHVPYFSIESLSISSIPSNHNVNITILSNTTNPDFNLDYIIYHAAPNLPIDDDSSTALIFVDDTSPYIMYEPGVWSMDPPEGEDVFGKEFNLRDATT